jgi:hypothetical protein
MLSYVTEVSAGDESYDDERFQHLLSEYISTARAELQEPFTDTQEQVKSG